MEFMWLYSLCQCVLSVCVMVASVRLCMARSSSSSSSSSGVDIQGGSQRGEAPRPPQHGGIGGSCGGVSSCLRLCLGWVGAVGGAVGVPVSVLLNLRSPQCLYTCITLVCAPLLVRQFTMCLLLLLTLDGHLQRRLAQRYSSLVTRRRALCIVLLCWVGSVLCSFAQFIGSNVLNSWSSGSGFLLDGNWTSSDPSPSPPLASKYPHGFKVIGQYLPYGGFLSKFYVEDLHNFTYAEIHGSHWAVCAPDTILSPQFQVYVYGVTSFLLPFLGLLAIYLDLMCAVPRQSPFFEPTAETPKHESSSQARSLALSLSLLVLLCLPLHINHILLLSAPGTRPPVWAHQVAAFLCQVYSLVPQLLSTPNNKKPEGGEQTSCRGKAVGRALCEAVHAAPWCSANHSLKAKVCPEV